MRNKPIKFHTPTGQYWFTGCTHVFHNQPFIWEKRGFKSIKDHADYVRITINDLVKPTDTLFHLGDGFLNSTPDEVKAWLSEVKCQNIYYLSGNHESSTSKIYLEALRLISKDSYNLYPLRFRNVMFSGPSMEIELGGRMITLSHFPHAVWNHSHHGSWHLHSHCHGTFKESLPYHATGKRLDVGWDVFARPINVAELDEIMARKSIAFVDHHNRQTT